MKMVMVAYNEALDRDVMDALRTCCDVVSFTKWTRVMGQGRQSDPHLLSHVWPKGNHVLMACVEDDRAAKIMAAVRELRAAVGREGIKAFCWSVEEAT